VRLNYLQYFLTILGIWEVLRATASLAATFSATQRMGMRWHFLQYDQRSRISRSAPRLQQSRVPRGCDRRACGTCGGFGALRPQSRTVATLFRRQGGA
jgi:hypothetical protein